MILYNKVKIKVFYNTVLVAFDLFQNKYYEINQNYECKYSVFNYTYRTEYRVTKPITVTLVV